MNLKYKAGITVLAGETSFSAKYNLKVSQIVAAHVSILT
jgi:hypothetical protein